MKAACRVLRRTLFLAALAAVLVACGGGGAAGDDARAGDDASDVGGAGDVVATDAPSDAAADLSGPDAGPDAAGDAREDAGPRDVAGDAPPADVPDPSDVRDVGPDVPQGFDPHHRTGFTDAVDLLAWAGDQQDPAQVKFAITAFATADPSVFFQDSMFFQLHDEWYWWHLMNGERVPGVDLDEPVEGLSFGSIAEIVAYCDDMPPACAALGLSYAGDRLYSEAFYDLALRTEPRGLGLGSLLHYPPDAARPLPGELWLFELEYQDTADEATIGRFFTLLEATLPADVGPALKWLARSQRQVLLGEAIRAGGGPYADRVVTYDDLVVPGSAQVYNAGVAAGFLEKIPSGASVTILRSDRIAVLEEIPDDLPPVAAIVTAVPQTPLAHLNLLAKSRGTPNAFVAGAFSDPRIDEWARFHVPVALWATAEGVRWQQLTLAEWQRYQELQQLQTPPLVAVPPVDLASAPYVVDLGPLGLADVAALTPLIGGKAAGMAALQDAPALTKPDQPLAITVRAYADHIAPIEAQIRALLADPYFVADPRVRLIALEGEADFYTVHGDTPTMHAWVEDLLADPQAGAALLAAIQAGGLRRWIRDLEIPPTLLASLTDALRAQFPDFAATQGLRFRSSSTAEDIEGFNGAGLYTSNTGFLDPPVDGHDVAWALRKTWASYWGFGAFEERRLAGIDHLSGRMGVLVHARFDDAAEVANGVYTMTYRRGFGGAGTEPDGVSMVINVQDGAVSVTNPDGETVPEILSVSDLGSGEGPQVTRVQHSTLAPDRWLLTDAQALALFEGSRPLAAAWLATANAELSAPRQRMTLVLDFEFRWMEAGWPALATGPAWPRRMIVKQARTLEAPTRMPPQVLAMPVPRDLLSEVVRVDQRICRSAFFTLVTYEFYTAGEGGLFDYVGQPFNAFVQWSFRAPIPGLGFADGDQVMLDHTQFDYIGHPFMHHGPWDLSCEVDPEVAAAVGLAAFGIYEWGSWDISDGTNHYQSEDREAQCVVATVLSTPADYLRGLFPVDEPTEL